MTEGVVTLSPPVPPMLAKAVGDAVPGQDSVPGGLSYEPKWDGFRCLIFRLPDQIVLQSRSEEDLTYCFPEMATAAEQLAPGTVIDGELIIVTDRHLNFDALSSRLRPRKESGGSNIAALAERFPTQFVAFDVLATAGGSLLSASFAERRRVLEALAPGLPDSMHITPATTDEGVAQRWFHTFEGAGLDGLVAKPLTGTYRPGKRDLLKVKHRRTTDAVVAGWRAHTNPGPDGQDVVGSLLLGLYDDDGRLHQVGSASGFTAARRLELLSELPGAPSPAHPWAQPVEGVRGPGGPSRWRKRGNEGLHLIEPERVLEVAYDAMEGDRFRHVTRFVRWRPDRRPESCRFDQLERPTPVDIDSLLQ